jgi:hypothetical protein
MKHRRNRPSWTLTWPGLHASLGLTQTVTCSGSPRRPLTHLPMLPRVSLLLPSRHHLQRCCTGNHRAALRYLRTPTCSIARPESFKPRNLLIFRGLPGCLPPLLTCCGAPRRRVDRLWITIATGTPCGRPFRTVHRLAKPCCRPSFTKRPVPDCRLPPALDEAWTMLPAQRRIHSSSGVFS